MAGPNPFKWFRKHQTKALAALGVLAMLSFIVVPSLMQLIPSGGSQANKDIARCREFGPVTEYSLHVLRENRRSLASFYNVLHGNLVGATGENRQMLYPLESVINQLSMRSGPEELVNDWLIARYGQKLGITIGKQTIADFLRQVTAHLISDAALSATMRSVGINAAVLQALISEQMIVDQVRTMFEVSQMSVTPLTRWNWFQRMNRKITAEVAAVPVDLFVTKVADPATRELQKFFEENKSRIFDPSEPESGFMIPNRVAFQYVKAVPSEKTLASISQEEIEKFYGENKITLFKKPITPIEQRPTLPGQGSGSLFQPGALPFPTPLSAPPRRPANVIRLTDDVTEPEEKSTDEPKPEEKPADESKPEKRDEMSSLTPMTRLVSFAEEKPAEDAPKPDPEGIAPGTDAANAEIDLSILFKPLAEVEDEIRAILAGRKVDEAIPIIESQMRDYFTAFNINFDQAKEAPPMLDLKPLADEYEFEFFSTPLIADHEARRLNFAHGIQEREFLESLFHGAAIPFEPQIVEGDSAKYLFWVTDFTMQEEPENIEKIRDTVLFRWKEVNARPLAMKRAEELLEQAKASEKTLAEAFAGLGDVKVVETEPFTWKSYGESMLAAFFAMRGIPPRLGEVREQGVAVGDSEIDNRLIVAPGERFMETAYGLGVGDIGLAMNQPETVIYIIRVTGSSPSDDVLRDRFQSAPVAEYRLAGLPEQIMEAREAWLQQIQDEVGFKWINKPDR